MSTSVCAGTKKKKKTAPKISSRDLAMELSVGLSCMMDDIRKNELLMEEKPNYWNFLNVLWTFLQEEFDLDLREYEILKQKIFLEAGNERLPEV